MSIVSDLQNPNVKPAIDIDAKEFGFLISEAVSDCNDVDGVAWTSVARQVADALGILMTEDA